MLFVGLYDLVSYHVRQILLGVSVHVCRLDGLSEFHHYLHPFDPGEVVLHKIAAVDDGHGHDGGPGLCGDLKAAGMEGKELAFHFASGPLGEYKHVPARLDLFDGRKDGLQALPGILAVQEKAVDVFHKKV